MNAKPLSNMSDSPNDRLPLTTSHLLFGCPLETVPEVNVTNLRLNRYISNIHIHIIQMKQHLWQCWSKEYVSEVQKRIKWKIHYDS